jgi:hypothetical protein
MAVHTRKSAPAAGSRLLLPNVLFGALLCAFVVAIHVIDQGGPTALRSPTYVGYLYYVLEVAGTVAVLLLLSRRLVQLGWVVALGVAAGPLVGYIVTRSIGLPHYTEDIGNWTEPLGLASLAVEGLLLICALAALAATIRAHGQVRSP